MFLFMTLASCATSQYYSSFRGRWNISLSTFNNDGDIIESKSMYTFLNSTPSEEAISGDVIGLDEDGIYSPLYVLEIRPDTENEATSALVYFGANGEEPSFAVKLENTNIVTGTASDFAYSIHIAENRITMALYDTKEGTYSSYIFTRPGARDNGKKFTFESFMPIISMVVMQYFMHSRNQRAAAEATTKTDDDTQNGSEKKDKDNGAEQETKNEDNKGEIENGSADEEDPKDGDAGEEGHDGQK